MFAPLYRTRGGRRIDVNRQPRHLLHQAIQSAGGAQASSGKVIAELPIGFWRYLGSNAHEKILWVSSLHQVFPRGTDRQDIDRPVGRLHQLRNRVAHHEPLLRTKVTVRFADLSRIASLLDPQLDQYLEATTTVPTGSAADPDQRFNPPILNRLMTRLFRHLLGLRSIRPDRSRCRCSTRFLRCRRAPKTCGHRSR